MTVVSEKVQYIKSYVLFSSICVSLSHLCHVVPYEAVQYQSLAPDLTRGIG